MDGDKSLGDLDDLQLEDLETQQNKIADQLAELSAVEVLPAGYKAVSGPFEASEMDFSSSAWLLRLLQVQAWLNPDAEVPPKSAEADPIGCARRFFSEIRAESPDACVQDLDGLVKLTPEGAEYLATRLDTSLRLQNMFSESLESLNRKQATAKWVESWEEEAEIDLPASEPIKAHSEVWDISEFGYRAGKGVVNLNPSYQRGDVWPTSDAQKLIESILRGIPLPSIILLEPRGTSKKKIQYEVVDGKQRLTSILRFIGKHPQALERVKAMSALHPKANLSQLFESDYKKFRRAWKNAVGESLADKREAEYYFPFRLAQKSKALTGPLSELAGKYYFEITDVKINVAESEETVGELFTRKSLYKIPLILYSDATPKQIQEVFHLYNRQGKHLNAEEIRNALFHEVDLVRLLLLASGDNRDAETLAPYFPEGERHLLDSISKCLEDYRFGSARYRKTKLLSWLLAALFQPSLKGEDLVIRSTAKQIDELLREIQGATSGRSAHRLADHQALVELIRATETCLDAHSSADCWDREFKDDDRGQKWQELQLVASLVGVFLIGVLESSPSDVLSVYRAEILRFTKSRRRPEKTQNKTQWGFIGEVSLGILEVVGIDLKRLDVELLKRYGVSCIATLQAARVHFSQREVD